MNISTENFLAAFNFAASVSPKSDVRYYLNGLCVDVQGDHVTLVATDGHRLTCVELEGFTGLEAGQVIIGIKHFPIIRALLKNVKSDLELKFKPRVTDGTIEVTDGIIEINGHTIDGIDGRFPDWRRVRVADTLHDSDGSGFFNGAYLADAYSACAKLSVRKDKGVFSQLKGTDLIRLTVRDLPVGVVAADMTVMGMRR
jgi:DNA polymerase-3 subunit beta